MKDKFEYTTEGFMKAKEWLESIKDSYSYENLDGISLVHYANDKYRRLNK